MKAKIKTYHSNRLFHTILDSTEKYILFPLILNKIYFKPLKFISSLIHEFTTTSLVLMKMGNTLN